MNQFKIYFSSKTYAAAHSGEWLDSLAMYIRLNQVHSGKVFYHKTGKRTDLYRKLSQLTGVGLTTLVKHVQVLVEKGLIILGENEMKLVGNDKRTMRINNNKLMFVNTTFKTYKEIKRFLNTIPVISNLLRQKKKIEKKKHFSRLKHAVDNGKRISRRDFLTLQRFMKKNGELSVINEELNLTVEKIKELVQRKSDTTISNLKKFLRDYGILGYRNEWHPIFENVTRQDYAHLLSYDLLGYKGTFFHKGKVYINKPTAFNLCF